MSHYSFERRAKATRRKAIWMAVLFHVLVLGGFIYGDQIMGLIQWVMELPFAWDTPRP